MKLIVAIVRPFKVDEIITAFEAIEGFPGMTVTNSEGFGRRFGTALYDSLDPFMPGKRLEIAANDELVDQIVAAIKQRAHTGRKGDGLIVVLNIENALLI
ncbi:MAG: P-II family nitrogen regulator [Acidobacteria bacterium]|nr:Nitrogen regulatory protein P-II [Pyrinomonadaceae bacterium]RIJ96346.1 MAG: P-II family nitrogen regulator [Acidobacteriota bacterium]